MRRSLLGNSLNKASSMPVWSGKCRWGVIGLTLVAWSSQPAAAAPFCLTSNVLTPQCIYTDPVECSHRAAQIHGACAANPAEMRAFSGNQEFCVTDATRTGLCAYPDQASCDHAVERRAGSVCVRQPTATQPPGFSRANNQPR
jgi:hypothetical protein